MDIGTLQSLLGHADIRTTMVYPHVTNKLLSQAVSPLYKLSDASSENNPQDPFQKTEESDDE
ncbi:MAG: hypothetical protein GY866_23920 [Proteobacteria bacterium]|nr:hypothetical protein [Pseudomonadota bacterium]